MTGISQPGRRGLERAQNIPNAHPDADLLSAFAEQALTAREREQVMAHLASCATCRDVVSLAAPPLAEAATSQPVPKPALWNWSVLRWGAVAATAVIVAFAVTIGLNGHKSANLNPLTSEKAPLPGKIHSTTPVESEPAQVPPSLGMKAPHVRYEKVTPKSQNKIPDLYRHIGATSSERKNSESGPPQQRMTSSASIPVVSGNVAVRLDVHNEPSASSSVPTEKSPVPPSAPLMQRTLPTPVEATKSMMVTGESVPAPSGTTAKVTPSFEPQKTPIDSFAPNALQRSIGLRLQWMISPEGYLLSSSDQGRSWNRQLPNERFTHVQSIGRQVWAAGAGGMLMHSKNGGKTWTRVTPIDTNSGAKLEGDVNSIVFTDPDNGTLTTTAGERWITTDAGQTWRKQ